MMGSKPSVKFSPESENRIFIVDSWKREKLWYTEDEFIGRKNKSMQEASEWRGWGYGSLLENSFESPRMDIQKHLNAFVTQTDNRNMRGLEKLVAPQHREERVSNRKRAIQTVLAHQRVLGTKENMDSEERSRQLRTISKLFSRRCDNFALRIGKADSLALRIGKADEIYVHRSSKENEAAYHYENNLSLNHSGQVYASLHTVNSPVFKNNTNFFNNVATTSQRCYV